MERAFRFLLVPYLMIPLQLQFTTYISKCTATNAATRKYYGIISAQLVLLYLLQCGDASHVVYVYSRVLNDQQLTLFGFTAKNTSYKQLATTMVDQSVATLNVTDNGSL
jgi:hypothetical protein